MKRHVYCTLPCNEGIKETIFDIPVYFGHTRIFLTYPYICYITVYFWHTRIFLTYPYIFSMTVQRRGLMLLYKGTVLWHFWQLFVHAPNPPRPWLTGKNVMTFTAPRTPRCTVSHSVEFCWHKISPCRPLLSTKTDTYCWCAIQTKTVYYYHFIRLALKKFRSQNFREHEIICKTV